MESPRLSPLLITLFAALAVLYPVATGTRSQATNATAPADTSRGKPDSSVGGQGSTDFPTAKDLVADFLFSGEPGETGSSGQPPDSSYSIDFLVATVPDPVSSRLPHFFDSFVESLESAAEASSYTLDRFALPWIEKGSGAHDEVASWQQRLYESVPGLILLRDPQDRKLLLIFLVGETPTTGIHKAAMFSALDQMARFYPWDSKHAELPPGFPQVSDPTAALSIMGPSFSGSATALRFVIDRWSGSRGNVPNLRFQIISGTATAIDSSSLA